MTKTAPRIVKMAPRIVKMASSPPILAPDSTDHTHPVAHTHTKQVCLCQTSKITKVIVVGHIYGHASKLKAKNPDLLRRRYIAM